MSPIEVEAARINLELTIEARIKQVDSIEATLPYADGRTYYRDNRKLRALYQEIAVLKEGLLTYMPGAQIKLELNLKEGGDNHG